MKTLSFILLTFLLKLLKEFVLSIFTSKLLIKVLKIKN
jgi:hypothetical protein